MRKIITIVLIVVVVVGGLTMAAIKNKPKAPPPTTKEIQADQGIPIETAVITTGNIEQSVEITGSLAALDQVTLSSKVPGRLAAVYVREGDSISAGQVVAMLDQDDAKRSLESAQEGMQSAKSRLSQARTTAKVTKIQSDAAIMQAKASLKSAKARFEVAKSPARSQEKLVAENRVAAAKANLDNKEADYKRYKQLLDKGAISESTFDMYKTQLTIAETDYKTAQEQLAMIKEGGRSEDVETAQAAVDVAEEALRSAEANASQNLLRAEDIKSAVAMVGQAQAAVSLARQQLSYTYIKSPILGQISSRTAEAGQVVSPGQALASVVNLGSIYFKGDVSEKEVVNIAVGQQVNVKIDAVTGKTFGGTVAEIYPSGSETSRNFFVRIAISGKSADLKPGMFARGNIVTSVHRDVLLVPKDAIDQRSGTSMVFVVSDDLKTLKAQSAKKGKKVARVEIRKKVTRYDVTALTEDYRYVEIASPNSLKVGDVVATAGRQNLSDGVKVLLSK
ncbi:MAG: efflux RND transporter periplasmic adaptor subunit [Armatimonadetes bacterium]|nr:efflux RND transporter periplasmic adaptor subunit [Armatimonadota bacterium]